MRATGLQLPAGPESLVRRPRAQDRRAEHQPSTARPERAQTAERRYEPTRCPGAPYTTSRASARRQILCAPLSSAREAAHSADQQPPLAQNAGSDDLVCYARGPDVNSFHSLVLAHMSFAAGRSLRSPSYIPTSWNNTSHLTGRLFALLVCLAATTGPTVYIAMVDSKDDDSNIPVIISIVQLEPSVLIALAFAIIPSGRMFRDRVTGKSTSYLALQGKTRMASMSLWIIIFLCKFVESYFFLPAPSAQWYT